MGKLFSILTITLLFVTVSTLGFNTGLVHGADGTFGKTTIGGSYTNLAQYWYGSRYQISEDGTASSVSVYVQEMNGENRPLKVAIYDDNNGKPFNLLAQGTGTVPLGFTGWMNVTLSSSPNLIAGDYYWLMANAIASVKNLKFYYSVGTTNQGVYGTTSYASFPPNPCTYSNLNNRAYSIYCNYSAEREFGTIPPNGAVDVSVGTAITVNFPVSMNKASTESAFTVTPSVSGSFSWSSGDTVMTFTPNSNLEYATAYTATITSAAQTTEGKNLVPYSWSFATEPSPSQCYPIFGNNVAGSNYTNLCQYWYGSSYQCNGLLGGQARNISLYVQEMNGEDRPLKVAIYQDSGGGPSIPSIGVPTTLLAQGVGTVPAGFKGWFTISLSPYQNLSGARYYWLVADAQASGKTLRFYCSSQAANQPSKGVYGTTSYSSFPTNPCAYSGFRNRAYSIYCTYYQPFV